MFKTLRDAWSIPEIRKKLLYTLLMLLIFRLGSAVVVPFLDTSTVSTWMASNATGGNFLEYLDIITGGALSQATVFSLSITPYINASIIMQLLTYALPPLERMRDEGEEGQKKLNKITAAVSLALSVFMSFAYYLTLKNQMNAVVDGGSKAANVFIAFVIILSFIAGTSIVVWMGNQINDKGIGNGISMLLFAGIIARGPSAVIGLFDYMKTGEAKNIILVIAILVVFVLMIGFIIFMNEAERRIPIQYAKRVVGRKQYGGQNTFIPIKIAMSGVMPIIFAMAFMSLPSTLKMFIEPKSGSFYDHFLHWFEYTHPFYACLYFVLIIGFNYFYVSMQYNPLEIANNLRQNNGGIPGIRPGRPTSDYLKKVLSKITLVGAVFLGIIAIFPIIFTSITKMNIAMGGTSILIVVSVALETARTMESQMMMRHHKSILE